MSVIWGRGTVTSGGFGDSLNKQYAGEHWVYAHSYAQGDSGWNLSTITCGTQWPCFPSPGEAGHLSARPGDTCCYMLEEVGLPLEYFAAGILLFSWLGKSGGTSLVFTTL